MKLRSISFKNFLSYRVAQGMNFHPEKNGLIVIQGEMGHGKSNLLNAFYWCLFDDLWHSDEAKFLNNPDPLKYNLFNTGSLKDNSSNGSFIDLYVEICLYDKDKNLIKIRRDHGGTYVNNQWVYNSKSSLTVEKTVTKTGASSIYENNEAKGQVGLLFPKAISNYFLFRGENRTELANLTGKGTFFNALAELSKLKLFQRMEEHVLGAYKTASKEAANIMGGDVEKQLESERKQETTYDEAFKTFNDIKEEIQNEFQTARDKYEELTDQINKHADAIEKQNRIQRFEFEIKHLDSLLKDLQKKKKDSITTDWSVLLARGLPEIIQTKHKHGISKGKFPPPVSMKAIHESIEKHKCMLCETKLDKSTIKYLEQLIKDKEDYDDIIGVIERLSDDSEIIQNRIKNVPNKIVELDVLIQQHLDKIETKNNSINVLRNEIGKLSTDLKGLTVKQTQLQEDQLEITRRLNNNNNQTDETKRKLDKIRRNIQNLEDQLGKGTLESERLRLAKKAAQAATLLKNEYKTYLFDTIEKLTQQNWEKICYDILTYKTIKLDHENSYFEVLDGNGVSRRSTMNTGHKIVLVLSFIAGLIRFARDNWSEEIPMVLDAPLSEIGQTARPFVLKGWNTIFGQTILILQDNTITPEIEAEMKNDIIKKYFLTYDSNEESTMVN